jgi:hypothetical protein
MQPARNHQVQNEPQISFEAEADPFPKPAQLDDLFAFDAGQRRNGRPQQERTCDTDAFENTALDSFLESLDINNDVRQFRH